MKVKKNLIIPEGITEITEQTFTKEQLKSVESITFPKSLQEISDYVFEDCNKIKEVYFQNENSIKIGNFVFARCKKLEKVEFKRYDNIDVGECVFSHTPYETANFNKDGAFIIGNTLISVSKKIKKYEIPKKVTRILPAAFAKGKIETIVIPDTITKIEKWTFEESKLKHITLPDTLTQIGDNAFKDCVLLEELVIPASVTEIGTLALYNLPNCTITILNKAEEEWSNDYLHLNSFLPMQAFGELDCLFEDIKEARVKKVRAYYGSRAMRCAKKWGLPFESLGGTPQKYTYIDEDFCCEGTKLISYLGHEKTVYVPDGITEIGEYAFANNYSQTRCVRLPHSVEKICQGAFMWCVSLCAIDANGVKEIESSAFSNCSNIEADVFPRLEKIHPKAFSGCNKMFVDNILMRCSFNCEKELKVEEDKYLKICNDYYENGNSEKAKEYLIRAGKISKRRWELNKENFVKAMDKLGVTEEELQNKI